MSSDGPPQRELRVVVLGANLSHKTSVINTLLGQAGQECIKRTASCVRSEGEVNGRKLILIDSPGWWRNYLLSETAEFIKQELVVSVTKCPPGPHAFVLTVSTDAPFTKKNRRSIEEHLGLFGENIWGHTIVVFTRGEYLCGKSIEQHIESEGKHLQWLIEKCGNRCHMLNIHSTEGCTEVSKLLEQIDIVSNHANISFELDEKTLREIEGKRSTYWERAKLRQQRVKDQRDNLYKYGVVHSLPELRMLLLGWLYSGKTSAKNTILGLEDDVNHIRTSKSERTSGKIAGRQVSVVDTPGWWKHLPAKYTPMWAKTELKQGMTLDSRAPNAILLAVPVDTAFVEEQRKITEDNMRVLGEQIWRHTMVLFTCGDMLGETNIEEHIEGEGEPLQWLVEKCGNRYHVMSWNDKEDKVKELLMKIEEMVACNSFFHPEPKPQEIGVEETTEEREVVEREMATFLDQKWQRMDKAMEEKIRIIYRERHNGSMNADLDFSDDHPPESTLEEIGSSKPMNVQDPFKQSTVDEFTGHEHQNDDINAPQLKHMREMLEKEWSRREIGITRRFQHVISDLRESETSSEVDAQDLRRSFRKVVRWMHQGTSGHGSDEDTEEIK